MRCTSRVEPPQIAAARHQVSKFGATFGSGTWRASATLALRALTDVVRLAERVTAELVIQRSA